jgi:mono/diheme cytochrome c family protein
VARIAGLTVLLVVGILAAWLLLSPPRAWLNLTRTVEVTPAVGQKLAAEHGCLSCHRIGAQGALKAPGLNGISQRLAGAEGDQVRLWITNPRAIDRSTAMPRFRLSDSEIDAILVYLASIDPQQ